MSVFSSEKYLLYGKQYRWRVLKDGVPFRVDDGLERSYMRKRDVIEAVKQAEAWDKWEALVYADDASGTYHWNENELKQIADLAAALRDNLPRWTFHGRFPFCEIARRAHRKNAEDLLKDDSCWVNARWIRAETRRVMAARRKAFHDVRLRLKEKR